MWRVYTTRESTLRLSNSAAVLILTSHKLLWPWYIRYPSPQRRSDPASVLDTVPQPGSRTRCHWSKLELHYIEFGHLLVGTSKAYRRGL